MGDELGYGFLDHMFKMSCSFSSFCDWMTATYESYSGDENCASFVSVPTFIKWFFSWAAAFKLDFRQDVDPFCKHSSKVLACDGTHVGVSLRKLSITPVEQPETDEEVPTLHRRYDRVFLFQRDELTKKQMHDAREHLKSLCKRVMSGEAGGGPADDQAANNALLFQACPAPEALDVVQRFVFRSFDHALLFAVADVLSVLACDNPVSALLSCACVDVVQRAVLDLQSGEPAACLNPLNHVSPELKRLLEAARTTAAEDDGVSVCSFVLYLCDRVTSMHTGDRAAQAPSPVPGSYNPPSGAAYYFTPSGNKVRRMPKYALNDTRREQFDDPPSGGENCSKVYPQVSTGGFSYLFLWFCPIHGHCYGCHLISGGDGRKDPFASMMLYLESPPEVVFYDNACQLSEYSLNREPDFFQNTRFFHDVFHGFSHKCSKAFRSARIPSLSVNSEICEQFNARLQCIKYTGSHLSQPHFMFLVQLVLHFWNREKTECFRSKLSTAADGML
jgi:hypothetical protein